MDSMKWLVSFAGFGAQRAALSQDAESPESELCFRVDLFCCFFGTRLAGTHPLCSALATERISVSSLTSAVPCLFLGLWVC